MSRAMNLSKPETATMKRTEKRGEEPETGFSDEGKTSEYRF